MLHRIAVRYSSIGFLKKRRVNLIETSKDNYMFEIITRAFKVHLDDTRGN